MIKLENCVATKDDTPMFISWDRAYIEKEVAQLKVGESKIIETV